MIRAEYDSFVAPDQKLQAAQQAAILTPEFNTMGKPLPIKGKRPSSKGRETWQGEDYKAVVMIFLSGGADSWSMMYPTPDTEQYEQLADHRTDLNLNADELIHPPLNFMDGKFSAHIQFQWLAKQFNVDGTAAFFTNLGGLVEPLLKQDMQNPMKEKCIRLFSHSDMVRGAETLECQTMGTSPMGAGGRIADALS